MRKTTLAAAIVTAALVSACAEQQAAAPAPTNMVADDSLSCSAIIKEQEANTKALRITHDEYLDQTKFTRSSVFMAAQESAPKLNARQEILAKLHAKRGC